MVPKDIINHNFGDVLIFNNVLVVRNDINDKRNMSIKERRENFNDF